MNRLLAIIIIAITAASCLRLDSNLFNPTKTDRYLLNDYTEGSLHVYMSDSTDIPDSLIHQFSLFSNMNGDVAKIYAVYIGDINSIATDTVIMYCHGNAANMDEYWDRAELLANIGHKNRFGVLMIDYRGYGMSDGIPSEEGLYTDVNTALIWLKNNGLSDERLIMYGFSMGTAPATELTANPTVLRPAKLILEAPFASAAKMAQDAAGISMPSSYYTDLKIDNAEEIKKVQQPFLWLHGTDDSFLKIAHGEIIARNYAGVYKSENRITGGAHSNVPGIMGLNNYLIMLKNFIEH
jgi:pimeloyl-ACP methyl ester carboxylesterase